MTEEQEKYVCKKAHEIAWDLWNDENITCFGDLEIKMQTIVKNLTISDVSTSVCACDEKDRVEEDGMLFCIKCGSKWD